ncbi:MAG: chromosome segregation protein SMC [Alphaproteobacteria bacterium]|nr:chromosome segregation protein SMC [Alphaproteobacteria bacterium]
MPFTHLKITGFKSFAEPEEVTIDEGLTGIVGPNGCGKSNIVEALRWLMGETSAKSMRGGELDDVIFAGTSQRPARNFAEVTLTIDNSDASIATYASEDKIEISRRLDRGKGSTYRINGKPVRGRDVQLLFADLATGARSHGIVSQGRVGALINAKPTERRGLLEEAANTKGLQHRRHEATLRLNTAERNLTRVDDVLTQMDEQKSSLSKQARQAARYRSIADRIRMAEAQLLESRYRVDLANLETAKESDRACKRIVAEATVKVSASAKALEQANEALPSLRQRNAEVMAEKQRLDLAMADIDKEEERMASQTREAQTRLDQIISDIDRETQLQTDATNALDQLKTEQAELEASEKDDQPDLINAQEERGKARDLANQAEAELADITARYHALERDQSTLERQRQETQRRFDDVSAKLSALDLARLTTARDATNDTLKQAEATAHEAISQRETAMANAENLKDAAQVSRDKAVEAEALERRITGEIDTLASLLIDQNAEQDGPAVSTMITIKDGMEQALAAVLAKSLASPVGHDGQYKGGDGYWRQDISLSAKPDAPAKTTPLLQYLDVPDALISALSGVGVVADIETAISLQPDLKAGQMITTSSGGCWRWDGYIKLPGAAASTAERLRHEARHKELLDQIDDIRAKALAAREQANTDSRTSNEAEQNISTLRDMERQAQHHVLEATRQFEQAQAACATAETQKQDLEQAVADLTDTLKQIEKDLSELNSRDELAAQLQDKRATTDAARARLAEAMSSENTIMRSRELRQQKLHDVTRNLESWRLRYDGTFSRLAELKQRQDHVTEELAKLQDQPNMLIEKRNALAASIATSAETVQQAGDALARAETAQSAAANAHRTDEAALAQRREDMIRKEGELVVVQNAFDETINRIKEKLDTAPDQLADITGNTDTDTIPDHSQLSMLEARLERLLRERDNIGPVNLRAEMEMAEVEEKIIELTTERDDLVQAVATLRDAINQLNREGRERLLKSFADVNRHFGDLFKQLFNGGTAELVLTEGDDPLEAGLEIMASPPGKRLQSLSLLSGGEQALTALALIFAVFLTNPAPVCILDEVDAPLDDRNVGRFCAMINEIAAETDTRFIIVTHHRLTMAQMDRLFGVTMQQKGISQVVSVDLQTAEKYKQSA